MYTYRGITHSKAKVFSVTFVYGATQSDGYRPNYRHLTPKVDRNGFWPARFLCHGNSSPDEILSVCFAQEERKVYLKTHSGKVELDTEHLLHLSQRHLCTSAVERQPTNSGEQVTTWRDLNGLFYRHSHIVRLLLQSNSTELHLSMNILKLVAWLFDHRVLS
jgi:hypothetical protein